MIYIKIPVNSIEDAKKISDNLFGSMMWNGAIKDELLAFPYSSDFPVIIYKKEK